jgi:hypothetical protein
MRHFIVAGTMLLIALSVTFGTASVLQVLAQNHRSGVDPVVVEAQKPAVKTAIGKERSVIQVRTAGL